jgi:hypothetical protein
MADLYHYFGADLAAAANGDLLAADAGLLTQQLVLRRLLTNEGEYFFALDYGAGLPQFIGNAGNIPGITAVIRRQLNFERGVTKIPEPRIDVSPIPTGIFVHIVYNDAITGKPSVLSFNVNQ